MWRKQKAFWIGSLFATAIGAPHQHFLPCHSYSH
eukprot:COSAG01_NODE_63168_length_281_cov_0.587912_1_plen_33_part_01